MKATTKVIALVALLAVGFSGCRSKQAVETSVQPAPEEQVVEKWRNVQMPVSLIINQPLGMSLSGTATMVNNQYIYMSFRLLGFEVAQANLTPDEVDFVLKQPEKIWLKEPVGDKLAAMDLTFEKLQQMMLDDDEYSLKTTAAGRNIDVTLRWNRDDARWNVERPAAFSAPGSNYKKMTLQSAKTKLLGK